MYIYVYPGSMQLAPPPWKFMPETTENPTGKPTVAFTGSRARLYYSGLATGVVSRTHSPEQEVRAGCAPSKIPQLYAVSLHCVAEVVSRQSPVGP